MSTTPDDVKVEILDRAAAVKQLADHIADRTAFLVIAPPDMGATLVAPRPRCSWR